MNWTDLDTDDIMRESGTYRDILEHRKTCPKWTKEFCMDCFGGGLTLFLGKLKHEFALHAKKNNSPQPNLVSSRRIAASAPFEKMDIRDTVGDAIHAKDNKVGEGVE